jgi:hypothetical protein
VVQDQGAIIVEPADPPSVIDPRLAHNVLSFRAATSIDAGRGQLSEI